MIALALLLLGGALATGAVLLVPVAGWVSLLVASASFLTLRAAFRRIGAAAGLDEDEPDLRITVHQEWGA